MPIYLDYNATAPLRPEVLARMQEVLAQPANPSSAHAYGREARAILEEARRVVAEAVSAFPQQVIFCASATEANNWALKAFPDRKVLVSAVEHSSVLACAQSIISVDGAGIVRLDALEEALEHSGPALVSVMLANNETGVIQPIAKIAELCKKHAALLHCDAVQAVGKIPVDCGLLGADFFTVSGHKCGGPVGAAALIMRTKTPLPPMLTGGGQESRLRAGTENVAAIAGFAHALELAQDLTPMEQLRGWLAALGKELEAAGALALPQADAPRLPNTLCLVMPGVSAETQLMHFDLAGIAVSAGAACTSGRIEPSHVLRAMGVTEDLAGSAIRVSGGWATTQEALERFAEQWMALWKRAGKPNFRVPKALAT